MLIVRNEFWARRIDALELAWDDQAIIAWMLTVPCLYLITNIVNLKRYVGQTQFTAMKRWHEHVLDAKMRRYKMPLHTAIRKYGEASFVIDVLVDGLFSASELNELERMAICDLGTSILVNGYNVAGGGSNADSLGDDFGRRVSLGKLAAGTKRPDASLRFLMMDPEAKRLACSLGGRAIRGIPKKGDGGRRGSPTHAAAKIYHVFSPSGEYFNVTNLAEFCRKNGLCESCMRQCASPKHANATHRGGWRCFRLNDTAHAEQKTDIQHLSKRSCASTGGASRT